MIYVLLEHIKANSKTLFSLYSGIVDRLIGRNRGIIANKNTDIVIEGFPRCANTFAVLAFNQSNPEAKIAHHIHIISQLKTSLKYGIPCIVLICEPENAIKSKLIYRNASTSMKRIISQYIFFYRYVLNNKSKFVISDFNETLNNFGSIIERVNRKYNTSFNPFISSKENIAEIEAGINHLAKSVDKYQINKPSKDKDMAKDKIRIDKKDLEECWDIYNALVS